VATNIRFYKRNPRQGSKIS